MAEHTYKSGLDRVKFRVRQIIHVASIIRPKDWSRERDLHATKWFDYRYVSPLSATIAFAAAYQDVFRSEWAKHEDQEESTRVRGLTLGPTAGNEAEFTSLWRARQHADALGVPYQFYVQKCCDLQRSRGVRRIPRPNQLYALSWLRQTEEHVRAAWSEVQREAPVYSELPQFQAAAFRETAAQIAHCEWAVRSVDLGAQDRLSAVLVERRLISQARAEAEFGPDRVRRVKDDIAIRDPVDVSHLDVFDFVPSCALVPRAFSPSSSQCNGCHFRDTCGRAAPLVMAAVSKRHGSDDPRRLAEQNRKRLNQRDKRARDAKAKANCRETTSEAVTVPLRRSS